jgi:hypothetical protein
MLVCVNVRGLCAGPTWVLRSLGAIGQLVEPITAQAQQHCHATTSAYSSHAAHHSGHDTSVQRTEPDGDRRCPFPSKAA